MGALSFDQDVAFVTGEYKSSSGRLKRSVVIQTVKIGEEEITFTEKEARGNQRVSFKVDLGPEFVGDARGGWITAEGGTTIEVVKGSQEGTRKLLRGLIRQKLKDNFEDAVNTARELARKVQADAQG